MIILLILFIPIIIGLYKWQLANEYMLEQKLNNWSDIEQLFIDFNFKTSTKFPNIVELFKSGLSLRILGEHLISVIPLNAKPIPEINLITTLPPKNYSFDEVFKNAANVG